MTSYNLELIFVRLGPRRNIFLNGNIERLRVLFPKLSITVIDDEVSQRFRKVIPGVKYHIYRNQNLQSIQTARLVKSQIFRQGFWHFTAERLFAVLDYQSSNPGTPILHIESDVLLFPNFPFSDLIKLDFISWCTFNESKDVASLLYLPAHADSSWLKAEIQRQFIQNPESTDMTALSRISRQNQNKIRIFPPLSSMCISQLANPRNPKVLHDVTRLNQLDRHFFGIFDSAVIGMWLCGMDPENHNGKLLIHDKVMLNNGDSYIDPSGLRYNLDEQGNLYFLNDKIWIPIYNLHVHSKNRKILSTNWISELNEYVHLARNPEPLILRKLEILMSVLVQQGSLKGALRYLGSHPRLYPMAKLIGTLVHKLGPK